MKLFTMKLSIYLFQWMYLYEFDVYEIIYNENEMNDVLNLMHWYEFYVYTFIKRYEIDKTYSIIK